MTDPTPDPAVDPLDVALTKIAELERQATDYKLLIADMQNSARRLREDADRQRKYASEPVVKDLLGVFDNLDRAVAEARKAGDAGPLAQGVAATLTMFLAALERYGVRKIDTAPGAALDTNLHMAVMQQPSPEHPSGTVLQVLQHGFQLHDRVLRPASVIVAS
jgi:molecular chaperone GrpE